MFNIENPVFVYVLAAAISFVISIIIYLIVSPPMIFITAIFGVIWIIFWAFINWLICKKISVTAAWASTICCIILIGLSILSAPITIMGFRAKREIKK